MGSRAKVRIIHAGSTLDAPVITAGDEFLEALMPATAPLGNTTLAVVREDRESRPAMLLKSCGAPA